MSEKQREKELFGREDWCRQDDVIGRLTGFETEVDYLVTHTAHEFTEQFIDSLKDVQDKKFKAKILEEWRQKYIALIQLPMVTLNEKEQEQVDEDLEKLGRLRKAS